jgi:anti-sigma-K factor RskA
MSERDLLAAEQALGVLEGQALIEARGLLATDRAFAAAVAGWQERLAPLLDEIGDRSPPVAMWQRIADAVAESPQAGEVIQLRRRVGLWQGLTAVASAVAASLALVVGIDAARPPSVLQAPAAPIMVASLISPSKDVMVSAALEADGTTLTLMPGSMAPPPGRSLQLWLIPADGRPRSLGMVEKAERMAVDPGMAELFHDEPMLALSIEPEGGAPGGQPSGPMVASGQLRQV